MATIQTAADWQKQWFEIADATYLNTAAHAAMPRVSLRAVQSLARSEAASRKANIWTLCARDRFIGWAKSQTLFRR
jgi:hypothetical protein